MVRLVRAPGVYAPQDDTDLLVEAMRAAAIPADARVLDIGTGTGAPAIAAIRAGAAEVTGVEVSRRAVWTARVNAALPARAWDAGPDGRQLLDPLCARTFDLLAPDGVLLMVHSELCGVDTTLRQLRDNGLIEPGQRHEELVVIRGDRPERAQSHE